MLSAPRRPRAFALPLVVLIAFIASIAIVIILERHTAAQLTVKRQVDVYRGHHARRGYQEIITRWLETARGRASESNGPVGGGFYMEMPGDRRMVVRIQDGQGAALADTSALTGPRLALAAEVREHLLRQLTTGALPGVSQDDVLRPAGPPEVCLASAHPAVLEALVATTVLDESDARAALKSLLDLREEGRLTPGQVAQSLQDVGIDAEESTDLLSMLVEAPSLWLAEVEMVDPFGRVIERSGGLMTFTSGGRARAFNQPALFLTWETYPLDE